MKAIITFVDGNGQEAELSLWFEGRPYDVAQSYIVGLLPILQDCSDAYISQYRLVRRYTLTGSASPDADVSSNGILLYREGNERGTIVVPSLSRMFTQTVSGIQRNIFTRSELQLRGLLSKVESIPQGVTDRWGQPLPLRFVVGAIREGGA